MRSEPAGRGLGDRLPAPMPLPASIWEQFLLELAWRPSLPPPNDDASISLWGNCCLYATIRLSIKRPGPPLARTFWPW